MLVLLALTVMSACQSRESKIAAQLSKLATTPEQARLWQQAADQAQAPGLTNVEQADRPVATRQPSTGPNSSIQLQGTGLIPANVTSAIRILATSGLQNGEFAGPAVVRDVDASGERLLLDLGNNRSVTLQARTGGRPLGVKRNDTVTVDYRAGEDGDNRRQIVAVRAPGGAGVARITETGSRPLTVSVPLFSLVATQYAAEPGRGVAAARVDVHVGSEQRPLPAGASTQIGGVTVVIVANRVPSTAPAARLVEGSPYALEIVVWQ
jgi:hypothetical protein